MMGEMNRHGILMVVLTACMLVLHVQDVRACAKQGKLASLISYVGTNYGDTLNTLDGDPAVLARLQRLPVLARIQLKHNLEVRGAVDLIECHLVLSGNAPHKGGEENAIIDVNLYSGAVTVGILSQGNITIYLDKDPTAGSGYQAVPYAVRGWAAMAADGFSALTKPPLGTQIIRSDEK